MDLSTGQFKLGSFNDPYDFLSAVGGVSPREIILPESWDKKVSTLDTSSRFIDDLDLLWGTVTRTERPVLILTSVLVPGK